MKNLSVIWCVLLSLISFSSWAKDMSNLVYREEVAYEKFSDIPVTGAVTHPCKGQVKKGIRADSWTCFSSNGQLRFKGTYKKGKEDGEAVYYHENGQLMAKGKYKDGEEEGLWVGYHPDGTVDEVFTGNFNNGIKVSD